MKLIFSALILLASLASHAGKMCIHVFEPDFNAIKIDESELGKFNLDDYPNSSKSFYRSHFGRKVGTAFNMNQLRTIFGIRDRILLTNDKGKIESSEEAELMTVMKGRSVKIGDLITIAEFESAVVRSYYPLVEYVANKPQFKVHTKSMDDTIQDAMLGLVKAIRKYDLTREPVALFTSVAHWYISSAINKGFINEDVTNIYSGSVEYMWEHRRVLLIRSNLKQKNSGKLPSAEAIAAEYNKLHNYKEHISVERVKSIIDRQNFENSMTPLLSEIDGDVYVRQVMASKDYNKIQETFAGLVKYLFNKAKLTKREIITLVLRFDLPFSVELPNGTETDPTKLPDGGVTLRDIGTMMDVSFETIRLAEKSALQKIRKVVEADRNLTEDVQKETADISESH